MRPALRLMAAPARPFGAVGKRQVTEAGLGPPQYLGQGTGARNLSEQPFSASEPEYWTMQIDSQRANGRTTRRNDPRDGTYSDNAWLEVDVPFGWIPAEIGQLAVFVVDLQATPWMDPEVTFSLATPSAYDAVAPTQASASANNFYDNPSFLPFYCRPGSMQDPDAYQSISLQDSVAFLAMIHRSKGFPHLLTSSTDEYVSLGSWPLRSGPLEPSNPEDVTPQQTPPYSHGGSVVAIWNPSGTTLRFEQRLMASNAMPCLRGSYTQKDHVFVVNIDVSGVFQMTSWDGGGVTGPDKMPQVGEEFNCRVNGIWMPFIVQTRDIVEFTFTVTAPPDLSTMGAQVAVPCYISSWQINDTAFGFPAWRATLKLVPIKTAQYGGVATATERQFV